MLTQCMLKGMKVTTYQSNPCITMKVVASKPGGLEENEVLKKGRKTCKVKCKQSRLEITEILF